MRTLILGITGLAVFAAGILLITRAGALASDWQRLDDGSRQATIDGDRQTRLRQVGLGVAVVGTILVALAARRWVSVKPSDLPPVDAGAPAG
jgi:hypothetical protein